MSSLGNAATMNCANAIASLCSEVIKRVNLQHIYNYGDYRNIGIRNAVMDFIGNQLESIILAEHRCLA